MASYPFSGDAITFWHQRFLHQAQWTVELRKFLAQRYHLTSDSRLMEAGCGTGVITADMQRITGGKVIGVDLDFSTLTFAHRQYPYLQISCSNVEFLPFSTGFFDGVFCHFLLLWLTDPLKGLMELRRVTRPGGVVIALAEPDYSQRVIQPESLLQIGCIQRESLIHQGADPDIGHRLYEHFSAAGLEKIEAGMLHLPPESVYPQNNWESEWDVIQKDLEKIVSYDELVIFRRSFEAANLSGEFIYQIPTYYAVGIVP